LLHRSVVLQRIVEEPRFQRCAYQPLEVQYVVAERLVLVSR
jgi:hypothetical protein